MAVVITPTSKHLIELCDQDRHRCADVFSDQRPHLSYTDTSTSRRQEPAPDLIRGRNREGPSEVYLPLVGLPALGREAGAQRYAYLTG